MTSSGRRRPRCRRVESLRPLDTRRFPDSRPRGARRPSPIAGPMRRSAATTAHGRGPLPAPCPHREVDQRPDGQYSGATHCLVARAWTPAEPRPCRHESPLVDRARRCAGRRAGRFRTPGGLRPRRAHEPVREAAVAHQPAQDGHRRRRAPGQVRAARLAHEPAQEGHRPRRPLRRVRGERARRPRPGSATATGTGSRTATRSSARRARRAGRTPTATVCRTATR